MKFLAYLIAEILEVEGQELALRYPSDTKIEPCAIILAIHMWACITGHPDVVVVFLVTSCCT